MNAVKAQTSSWERRCRDLLRLLEGLTERHTELLRALQDQVEAMGRADHERMRITGARIESLTQGIAVQEGLRRQLMDAMGKELGLEPRRGRELTAGQMAERLSGTARETFEAASGRLRDVVDRVARANRLSAGVITGVLGHLKQVFAAIGREREPGGCYSGGGRSVRAPSMSILETVG